MLLCTLTSKGTFVLQSNLFANVILKNVRNKNINKFLLKNWLAVTTTRFSSQWSFWQSKVSHHKKLEMTETIMGNDKALSDDYGHLTVLFQDIREHASENADYFNQRNKKEFLQCFQTILNVIDPLQISLGVVAECCHKFDISENCKGNGYRSVISIVESCLQKILSNCQNVQKSRDKLFFRSYHSYMELDSYTQVVSRLLTVCNLAVVLLDYSEVGNLFPEDSIMDDMMLDFEKINRECFYGRSFGFQYSDSIRQAMQVIAVAMAAYGDGYDKHNHSFTRALSSMLHSGKYMVNPELRAQRITELTQHANIDFCKAFWSVTEEYGVQHAPLLLCPAMALNMEFEISCEPLQILSQDNKMITVEFPHLDGANTGIKCRLLSYVWREGQNGMRKKDISVLGPKPSQKSRYLMLHCHGGGFVAQSSKSHEMYLRYWAKELQIPILSIDYSLAPNAPYPQAINEVYFAYIWALKNLDRLGSTGEKICFSGDSAGANIVTATTLKAIQDNIRLPDSIVVAYPPYRIQFLPSPSRMLCLMDPLLPLGVLKSCIQAYTGAYRKEGTKRMDNFCYDGALYNAYDLDLGLDDNYNAMRTGANYHGMHHSYSESQLSIIKKKFLRNNQQYEEESASFCSEFPYSETESSHCSDSETQSLDDNKLDDVNSFNKPVRGNQDIASSMFSSLTDQVSSTVQGLKSGVTDYFYGGEQNKLPDGMHTSVIDDRINHEPNTIEKSDIKTNTLNKTCVTEAHKPSPPTSKDDDDDVIEDDVSDATSRLLLKPSSSKLSLCKQCLNKTENCTCGVNTVLYKRSEHKVHKHYKFSHHHIHGHTSSRKRSNSLTSHTKTSDQTPRQRSSTSLNLKESMSTPCSPTTKNKQLLNIRMSLLSHPDLSRTTSDDIYHRNHGDDSPRVLYDKTTDSCLILTPEESDYVSENHVLEDDNKLFGVSSQVFQDAKDPFMSPYLADDEMLKKLPPISIVACALDPLLDDSVEFVRKLHGLDNTAELYILEELPHGFLNFQPFSNEAREGCDLLIACIKKSLKMGMRQNDSTVAFNFLKSKKTQ